MNFAQRKNNRLSNYDYSQNGMYFITICAKEKLELFGKVINGAMILNELGEISMKCWLEIPLHFKNITLDEFIIMPNHIHGIIEINNVGNAYMRSGNNGRSKMLLSKLVQGFKSAVTRKSNGSIPERACAFPTTIW